MKKNMSYEYHHHKTDKTVNIRPVNLDKDLNMLHVWLNQPHTIPNWQLNKSKEDLYTHFLKAMEIPHQTLHILSINGQDLCYAELYDALQDRLANYYNVETGDYGFHLLIGPPEAIGQGHSEALFAALTDCLFKCHDAKRVFVEPNQNTKQFTILESKLGFSNLGSLTMPEKIATLYAVDADNFYQINCDAKKWPLVSMHFPNHPSDTAVEKWLAQIDELLTRASPCAVISTFSDHYQFSPAARRKQALWFKRNKDKLQAYCLGMVRVTTDTEMIAKITSNAMREGMPFLCIPANNLVEAQHIANDLLDKKIKADL